MEASLYGEGGFYQTRRPTEDFYTAPELHPAFGEALAVELAERLKAVSARSPRPWLVEAGCGDGRLFRAVLSRLRALAPELVGSLRFALVDRSRPALSSALAASRDLEGRLFGAASLESLPAFDGVVYSNELLDALPFHVLEKRGGKVWELRAGEDGRVDLGETPDPLADEARLVGPLLEEGGRHAVCLDRARWLALTAEKLRSGWLVSVDYGRRYPPGVPVPPRTFRRHRLGESLLERGCDLTANVDFERAIEEGKAVGLEPETFETLTSFLLRRGFAERLERAAGYAERNRLKTLVHPEGMGEVFKVLVQRKAS